MGIRYYVDDELIPDDGSKKIIELFEKNIEAKDCDIYIFPDIHYKNGSRVVNGMMMVSEKYIYPACLGVENCGFTVGKIINKTDSSELNESCKKYSQYCTEGKWRKYNNQQVKVLFEEYLKKDYEQKTVLYQFLGLDNLDKLLEKSKKFLTEDILNSASSSLGYLGGGNHFFEIHEISELYEDIKGVSIGQFIYILHSDSISVGDKINLLYSNLSELDYLKGIDKWMKKMMFRKAQISYFGRKGIIFKAPLELLKLLFSQKDYRKVRADSVVGKDLLFAHNMASIFGDINRDAIIKMWAELSDIEVEPILSHPHDNIQVESYAEKKVVVQRNGIQKIGSDPIYVLPGAMGTGLMIMKNTFNQETLFSANHGTGRIQDKHIARAYYRENETEDDLLERKIDLFRIGNGNIAEQNAKAFKELDSVCMAMEKYNLGKAIGKTRPITIVKG